MKAVHTFVAVVSATAGFFLSLSTAQAAEKSSADPATIQTNASKTQKSGKTSPANKTAATGKSTPAAQSEVIRIHGNRKPSTVASSATKSDTPLVETAQSVTVIDRHELDIRGVLSLNQALRYTAGIEPDLRGSTATRYDQFSLRGFTVPIFLDGLKQQDSPSGYATAQVDTSRLERIEVLKGPASALYGQSSPGGLVAMSSKLPGEGEAYGSVTATGGSYDLYRVDGDTGGYVTKDGFVRYRLYGTANGSHSQLTRTGSKRFGISPSLLFGGGTNTTMTVLGNYQYDPENASYGSVPLEGSLRRAAFGRIPRDYYDGDLGYEKFNRKHGAVTYIFSHQFNNDWSFTSRGRYDNIRTKYESVYTDGVYLDPATYERDMSQEALGNFSRGSIFANEVMHNLAFDSQFKGRFNTSILHHSFMAGFDYQQSHATELGGYGTAPAANIFAPNYHEQFTRPTAGFNYITQQQQFGVYGQDEITVDRLILTGSLRNDWYHSTQRETFAGSESKENPSQITWRASGLYHFKFGLAPYISYSTSFQPQAGVVSNNGGASTRQADPTIGKQLEGGFKYQIPNLPVLLSADGFHIEQTNVLVSVPNTNYSTESGKVHSDGFEFEAHVNVYKGLTVAASVSTQKIRDTSTGKPLIGGGKGNATLFAFYTLQSGPMKGFGIGGGVRHVAGSYGGTASYGDVHVPAYTLFDASMSYDLANLSRSLIGWKLNASARNLFDTRHITSCYGYAPYDEWCWYGERRTAQASLGFSW